MTGRKTRYEEVQVGRDFDHVCARFIMDLDPILCQGTQVADLIFARLQKLMKRLESGELFDLSFVDPLTKFAPHRVEHQFGHGTLVRVVGDGLKVEGDPLSCFVVDHMPTSLFVRHTVRGKPAPSSFSFSQGSTYFLKRPWRWSGRVGKSQTSWILTRVYPMSRALISSGVHHVPVNWRLQAVWLHTQSLRCRGWSMLSSTQLRHSGNVSFPPQRYGRTGWKRRAGGSTVQRASPN